MVLNGMSLCDFCFMPIEKEGECQRCGLTHETYNPEPGLLVPGSVLAGKYIIGRVLGRGGFGATYLAYSKILGRPVAIKEYMPLTLVYRNKGEETITVVSNDKEEVFRKGAERFFEEAKTMARFNKNQNIVSVYEFFYANGTAYYAMEFLEGTDLKKYIGKMGGKLSEEEAVRIIKSVCNALMVVHSTQTLHRDISPDNIYICYNGDVKLIDFGAAKMFIGDEQQSQSVVVKQGFAPVEQYTRRGKQGVWTDVYAVGATLYYALTGETPPDAIGRAENPELDFNFKLKYADKLYPIIQKCMEIKIADRYQSVVELLDALNTIPMQEAPPAYSAMPEYPISQSYPVSQSYPNSEAQSKKQQKTESNSQKSAVAIAVVAAVILLCICAVIVFKSISRDDEGKGGSQQTIAEKLGGIINLDDEPAGAEEAKEPSEEEKKEEAAPAASSQQAAKQPTKQQTKQKTKQQPQQSQSQSASQSSATSSASSQQSASSSSSSSAQSSSSSSAQSSSSSSAISSAPSQPSAPPQPSAPAQSAPSGPSAPSPSAPAGPSTSAPAGP